MAVVLLAMALAGHARPAGGIIECCIVKTSPPWLGGWWFRLPSQEAADRALDRLGFARAPAPLPEGTRREVMIGCSSLSWIPDPEVLALGMSARPGAPLIRSITYCSGRPAPPPPPRSAESGHPNGAVELIRVVAGSSSLDSACRVIGQQPISLGLSRPLRFGPAFRVEARRVREADLDYGGTLRVIETGPGDPLRAGASGWLGFTVRVLDLEATARVLKDRGVGFTRVDAEDGPMLRVAPEDGGGVLVEFAGGR